LYVVKLPLAGDSEVILLLVFKPNCHL